MFFPKSTPDLMQSLPCFPTTPHVEFLLRASQAFSGYGGCISDGTACACVLRRWFKVDRTSHAVRTSRHSFVARGRSWICRWVCAVRQLHGDSLGCWCISPGLGWHRERPPQWLGHRADSRRSRRNSIPWFALPIEFEDIGDMGSTVIYIGVVRRSACVQSRGNVQ